MSGSHRLTDGFTRRDSVRPEKQIYLQSDLCYEQEKKDNWMCKTKKKD